MTDLVENGRSGGSWTFQPGESHDVYLELCALSTTDLLSAQERRRLEEHLHDCPACRESHAQYQAIVDSGIPFSIVGAEQEAVRIPDECSVEEDESKLFARLDGEEVSAFPKAESPRGVVNPATLNAAPPRQPVDALWRQFAAAVVLSVVLGISLYRAGLSNAEKMAGSFPPSPPAAVAMPTKSNESQASSSADASRVPGRVEAAEVSAQRAQLETETEEVAELNDDRTRIEQRLIATENERDQFARNADQVAQNLEATEADLAAARRQLADADTRESEGTASRAALEQQIEGLRSDLERKDQEIARDQELLEDDHDIRELMGSRKLYITEVYDVAKNGETQRAFGRVFYTQGKSLIFYAYDLDQQPGVCEASSYQAWGRKGPNTAHAVNLGILYADNAAKKRWVLKSDDPRLLADIDAVFVTIEPQGGSNHPSGKPLLFAYLRVEPNHP